MKAFCRGASGATSCGARKRLVGFAGHRVVHASTALNLPVALKGPALRPPLLSGHPGARLCSALSSAGAADNDSADRLQALAARIVDDRALAQRLASSPLALDLHAVADGDAKTATEDDTAGRVVTDAPLPSTRQMKIYFLQHFVPFVGFGFCDNFIMILSGDFIDAKLGLTLGITTLAAAGIGNTLSDVIGLWISGVIETIGVLMGLPESGLTEEQRNDMRMRILRNTAMVIGMTAGCILGMFPLIYPEDWRLWESREQLQQLSQMEQLEQEEQLDQLQHQA